MKRLLCLLSLAAILAFLPQSDLLAQGASEEIAIDTPQDAEAAELAEKKAEEAEAEVKSYDDIKKLIRERKLDQAAQYLETAIKEAPDNDRLHDLRDSLAQSYMMTRKYDQSYEQLKASLEHRIANVDSPRNQSRLAMTVSLFRMAALRTGKRFAADESIDRAIDAIDGSDLGVVSVGAISTLIPQKAMYLAMRGDTDGANQLLRERIERIDSLDASGKMQESLITAKSRLLYAAASLPKATDDVKKEIDEFISEAVEDFPGSGAILSEFGRVQAMMISRTYRSDPEAAMERLTRAVSILKEGVDVDRNLKMYLARIKSYQPRIRSALRLKEMIGESAPPLEIDAWVNQGKLTEDSLKGKVVLIDFWSVWCGPCIATFPRLREWYDEFHDQGLEIVGVTRYYGYTWDDEAKRATKSKEKVAPDDELETLEQFMKHHDLRHPTIVTPKDSTMQKAYGVSGIPHAVLMDRKGIVQMIKVGSGSSNAQQLHEKIKELISQ